MNETEICLQLLNYPVTFDTSSDFECQKSETIEVMTVLLQENHKLIENIFNQDNQINSCPLTVSGSRTSLSIFAAKPKTNRNEIRSFRNKTVFIDQNSTSTLVVLSSLQILISDTEKEAIVGRGHYLRPPASLTAHRHTFTQNVSRRSIRFAHAEFLGRLQKGSVAERIKSSFRIINENITRSSVSTAVVFSSLLANPGVEPRLVRHKSSSRPLSHIRPNRGLR